MCFDVDEAVTAIVDGWSKNSRAVNSRAVLQGGLIIFTIQANWSGVWQRIAPFREQRAGYKSHDACRVRRVLLMPFRLLRRTTDAPRPRRRLSGFERMRRGGQFELSCTTSTE